MIGERADGETGRKVNARAGWRRDHAICREVCEIALARHVGRRRWRTALDGHLEENEQKAIAVNLTLKENYSQSPCCRVSLRENCKLACRCILFIPVSGVYSPGEMIGGRRLDYVTRSRSRENETEKGDWPAEARPRNCNNGSHRTSFRSPCQAFPRFLDDMKSSESIPLQVLLGSFLFFFFWEKINIAGLLVHLYIYFLIYIMPPFCQEVKLHI